MPEGFNIHLSPPAPRPVAVPAPAPIRESNPKYHKENAVVGVKLENYTKREPSEDGTYVLVTNHTERIEKIKQPEEIEAEKAEAEALQKAQDKMAMRVIAGVGVGLVGFFAWLTYMDRKTRETVIVPAEKHAEIEK